MRQKKILRLDTYIANKFGFSRSYSKNLIQTGSVTVNSCVELDPSFHVEKHFVAVRKKSQKVNILYKNKNFIIAYKPYNMAVCRSSTTPHIEDVLNEQIQKDCSLSSAEKPWEFGLVNRIDKLTEGIILLSRNSESYVFFKSLFREKKVKKYYYAYYEEDFPNLVFRVFLCPHGLYFFTMSDECFCNISFETHNLEIFENNVIKQCVTKIYKKEKYFLCELVTGRTHQIRRTMRELGRPIWGDTEYGHAQERMLLFSICIAFPINKIKNYL